MPAKPHRLGFYDQYPRLYDGLTFDEKVKLELALIRDSGLTFGETLAKLTATEKANHSNERTGRA